MTSHVVILGAGFGGLEVARRLSSVDGVHITLIDQADGFVFGFSKLEVLLGRQTIPQVQLLYRDLSLPGVVFRQERITSIDPRARHVVTSGGTYEADILVVALGADYDPAATPGFVEDGQEYYSVEGAARLHSVLSGFTGGSIVISILGVPFKCPPAPYEGALLLHDFLVSQGIRDKCQMQLITPMDSPIPVSPSSNEVILAALAERGIGWQSGRRVRSLDPVTHTAVLKDEEIPYDLFIGIPVHRVPAVVQESGLTEGGGDGWAAVDRRTLATPFPGVYALGDCADAPVPRAGVFAESAARAAADHIIATLTGGGEIRPYDGTGSCYLELGGGLVGAVQADFLSGPAPVAPFVGPSLELRAEKDAFAATRRARWFANSL